MNTFGNQCGSCVHLNINDHPSWRHICYCTERGKYYSITESASGCSRYEYDKNRDYYELSKWYVVTLICERLGLSCEQQAINDLFRFRLEVLEASPKYQEFLDEYDMAGPFLAKLLNMDDASLSKCRELFKLYLSKVICLIISKEYDDALSAYIEMLKKIENTYGFDIEKRNSSLLLRKTC